LERTIVTNNGVQKLYQLFEEADETWRDVYQAPGLEGVPITAEVPREENSVNAVRRHLLRHGAVAAALQDDETLAAAIATEAPVVRRAAHTGWRNGNTAFVSHRHVTGTSAEGTTVPPKSPLGRSDEQLKICGTLLGWQNTVLSARHSTPMIVSLSATFAAPLLGLVSRASFALVLYGSESFRKIDSTTGSGVSAWVRARKGLALPGCDTRRTLGRRARFQ
jgi:hypothetical protein